jgi:hypothetical protein
MWMTRRTYGLWREKRQFAEAEAAAGAGVEAGAPGALALEDEPFEDEVLEPAGTVLELRESVR